MRHHPWNQERAVNLSILTVSEPGEFLRVEARTSSKTGTALIAVALVV